MDHSMCGKYNPKIKAAKLGKAYQNYFRFTFNLAIFWEEISNVQSNISYIRICVDKEEKSFN